MELLLLVCGYHESRKCTKKKWKKRSKNGIYVFSALFDEPTSEIVINLNTLTRSNRHTHTHKGEKVRKPQILMGLQWQNEEKKRGNNSKNSFCARNNAQIEHNWSACVRRELHCQAHLQSIYCAFMIYRIGTIWPGFLR